VKKLYSDLDISAGQVPAIPRKATRTLLPISFILLSISSTQIGAALAKTLFASFGPVGVTGIRVASGALILLIIWHKQMRGAYGWKGYGLAACFGLILASMNLSFYLALNQLPLGVAVTLEFVGPLMLAVVQSRKVLDVIWVILAACGVLFLAPVGFLGGTSFKLAGMGLALLAGVCWAGYVLLSARVGRIFPGGSGLAVATCIAALLLLPPTIIQERSALLNPPLLLIGVGVGLLSTALPYSLEMEALRHLPSRVFSILLSLEPAIASLAGLIILHEQLSWRDMLAVILICLASIGVIAFQRPGPSKIASVTEA
jgi:inner membrane transporter RhtA